MNSACCSAKGGVMLQHGGPFGAAVVKDGHVVSCVHNTVLLEKNPTRHAEMNAIRIACRHLRREETGDLSDCVLYTTCEPCPMCWGAMQRAGLKESYVGVDRITAADFGFDDKIFYEEVEALHGLMSQAPHANFITPHKSPFIEVIQGMSVQKVCDRLISVQQQRHSSPRRSSSNVSKLLENTVHVSVRQEKAAFRDGFVAKGEEIMERYMDQAIDLALMTEQTSDLSHEAAVVVCMKSGKVLGSAATAIEGGDSTKSFVTTAIEQAAKSKDDYVLED